jgi:hypothetical protein
MKMKRVILIAMVISLLSIGSAALSVRAQGSHIAPSDDTADNFSNATLNDRYGFHTLALSLDTDPRTGPSYPFAISGYYYFHGDGTLDGKDTVSASFGGGPNGDQPAVVKREYTGTYHVNRDGTGHLTLNISPDFQPEADFVITEGGRQIEIIFAVTGNLNTFTMHKQHLGNREGDSPNRVRD